MAPVNALPVGTIVAYAGDFVREIPDGWLPCDGREVELELYPLLYRVIGNMYGGARPGLFMLPDLRNRFPMGANQNNETGSWGGRAEVNLVEDNLPPHSHGVDLHTDKDGAHSHTIEIPGGDTGNGDGCVEVGHRERHRNFPHIQSSGGEHKHHISGATASVGKSTGFNIIPHFVKVNYLIFSGRR